MMGLNSTYAKINRDSSRVKRKRNFIENIIGYENLNSQNHAT